jgi:hypothetical protein
MEGLMLVQDENDDAHAVGTPIPKTNTRLFPGL